MVNAVSIGNLQEVGITVENCCGVSAAVVFVLKFTNHSESCVFHNDDFTDFAFGICDNKLKDYSFAHDDFKNNAIKVWYKNRTFFFETTENIYMFDLGDDTLKIPLNTKIGISMSNLNKDNKLVSEKVKKIFIQLHKYN